MTGVFFRKAPIFFIAAILISLACSSIVFGHEKNESYIYLNAHENHFDGEVWFRLDDLRKFFKMEIPSEYEAARAAVISNRAELESYVKEHFRITTVDDEPIPYEIEKVDVKESEKFGHFAQLFFKTQTMDVPSVVKVQAAFLFDHDYYSRCVLSSRYNHFAPGETYSETFFSHVFSPWTSEQEIDFKNLQRIKAGERYYIWEGMRHIWIGLDHILFLVTLLLASVFVKRPVREDQNAGEGDMLTGDGSTMPSEVGVKPRYEWVPAESFGAAFWNIVKIVTIFTVAHSITLALASLDIISLPSRFVESFIALSIVLVAINNIIPTFRDRTWLIIFLLGLFHGLGFASVMKDLPFRMSNLTQLLLCFNVGVEIGQVAIVIVVFPIIFLLRKSPLYKPVILYGGSMVMILIAGYWFVERAMGWG